MSEERLQKILSQAGVASRRKAEEYIQQGRVVVNGQVVTELGSKADFERDHIKVDGKLLRRPGECVYLALHKPDNCVTTLDDPQGRETVKDLLGGFKPRVFPVGRLDYHSEGLLLLTNDGEFAHRLMAPANHITKVYVVKVTGALTEEQEKQFREGIPMHGRKTAPAELKCIKHGVNPWYEVKITEGRQNQIRIMFKHLGKLVEKLRRVKIGFLELDLPPGRYRSLTPQEVAKFRKLLKMDEGAQSMPATAPSAIAAPKPPLTPKPAGMPKPHTDKPGRGPRHAGTRYDGPRKFALPRGARPAAQGPAPRNAGSPDSRSPDRGPKPALRGEGRPGSVTRKAGPRDTGPRGAGPHSRGPRNAGSKKTGPGKPPRR